MQKHHENEKTKPIEFNLTAYGAENWSIHGSGFSTDALHRFSNPKNMTELIFQHDCREIYEFTA